MNNGQDARDYYKYLSYVIDSLHSCHSGIDSLTIINGLAHS